MRVKSSKMLRSALCLMLAVLLTMGTCVTAFAAEGDDTIKYVSLGDSMTNGYGLDGYFDANGNNVWGYSQTDAESYPVKVAREMGWELEQLAMSGFRAREIYYLLSGGTVYLDSYGELHIPSRCNPNGGADKVAQEYQEAVKNADVISMGVGTNNFGTFFTSRLYYYAGMGSTLHECNLNALLADVDAELAAEATMYQGKIMAKMNELLAENGITDAKLLEVCNDLANAAVYTVADFIISYKGILDYIAENNSGAEVIVVGMNNMMDGFTLTMEGEVIDLSEFYGYIVEIANAYMYGLPAAYDVANELNDGEYALDVYFAPIGAVEQIASTFTKENVQNSEVVRQRFIEDIVGICDHDVQCINATLLTCDDFEAGMVWDMVAPILSNIDQLKDVGIQIVPIGRAEIEAYEYMLEQEAERADEPNVPSPDKVPYLNPETNEPYGGGPENDDKQLTASQIFSCAIYVAFEDAIVEACSASGISGDSIMSLVNGFDGAFDGIMDSFSEDLFTEIQSEAYNQIIAAAVRGVQGMVGKWKGTAPGSQVTDEGTARAAVYNSALTMLEGYIENQNMRMITAGYIAANQDLNDLDKVNTPTTNEVMAWVTENYAGIPVAIVAGQAISPVLSTALTEDVTLAGLLNLFARYIIGEGMGCHPSEAGHVAIKSAVVNAYTTQHTAKDEVVERVEVTLSALYNILETYGPEVAAQVWQQWEEHGYVEAVDATIAELKTMLETRYDYYTETALPAITTAVDELGAQKDALCTELEALNTELAAKKAELDAVLAEQAIGDIYIPDISIDAELGGNEQTEVPEHECVVEGEGIEAELEAAIADLEHAIAVIEALIADITADMEDLLALAAEIAAAVEELEQTIASIGEAADDLAEAIEAAVAVLEDNEGVVNAVINSFNAGKAAVEAAAEVLELTLGTAEEMIADIDGMIAIIREDAETLYNKFMNDLPGCIEQIPEEAMMLVGGAVLLAQQGLEQGKALINAKLQEELNALSAEYSEEEIRAQIAELAAQYGIDEESINNEIESIKTQIETEVSERYAAIEADTIAQIDALKAEAQIKIDALNAELAGYQAELEAAAEEAKAEIQAQIDRVNGDIAVINEDLACAIGHLEEAAAIAYDEIVAEVTAAYETAMAELNTKLAELEAAYNEAVAALEASLDELQAAYEAAVAELTANAEQAIADLTAAVEAQIAELGKIGEDLAAVVDGIFAEMRDDLAAAQTAIGEILQGNLDAVEDLATALVDMGAEALVEAVENIREQLEIMFEEATTDDYGITEDSYYVALGDGSAVSQSYVDELAAHLGVDYTNLAQDGLAVEDAGAVIAANGDKIAAADLITLGFSNATFAGDAFAAMRNGNDLDWSTYVTENGVVYVEDALADIRAELIANGVTGEVMGMDLTDAAMAAIESYAYSSVAYACALPEVVNAIRGINTDATIIIVGQYNPFDGSIVELDGVQMDLGEYVDYLVDGAAVHGIAYCMLTGNAIYVEAPDAATDTPVVIDLWTLVDFMSGDISALYPNETGHEYIKNQILKALNYYVVEDYGMLGDANSDGVVNTLDARLILLYNANPEDTVSRYDINLAVCDVSGDGEINTIDARWILMYNANPAETVFPAA